MNTKTAMMVLGLLISHAASAQGPFNIGTINPGDSIVIMYDVSINNPLVPPSTTQISNQGTVTGANFGNQLTDDPDTGIPNDPTITLLNMFALPVTFTEFRAFEKASVVEVAWKVSAETGTLKYEVERSTDGRSFSKIGEVMAVGQSSYTFIDANPFAGNNFYRLKVVDIVPAVKYTHIVRVSLHALGSMINLYPNPVTEKMLNVEMKKLAKGTYDVVLLNNIGQLVFSKTIHHAGGSASEVIHLPGTITKGIYMVQIRGGSGIVYKKLVID